MPVTVLGTYLEQTFLFLLSITICHLSAEEELFWDSTLLIIFIFLKTSKPYFELFVGLKWLDLSMSSVVCLYVYLMSILDESYFFTESQRKRPYLSFLLLLLLLLLLCFLRLVLSSYSEAMAHYSCQPN